VTAFDLAFNKLLGIEGGYSNIPADRGGKTRYGITEAVARANGYAGDMSNLPIPIAQRIYREKYWDPLLLDQVALMSYSIADKTFDIGVNMGPSVAVRGFQTALNAFNRNGRDYADMDVANNMTPAAVNNLRRFLDLRGTDGEKVQFRAMNSQQGSRYLAIARDSPELEEFTFGWFLNRIA